MSDNFKRLATADLPTEYGHFQMVAFGASDSDYSPHIAMVSSKMIPNNPVLVRVHSECITGDLFGSKRCDCGAQLKESLKRIDEEGGVLLYLRQEGRGIGIVNKLKAYNLQDEGLDTAEANTALGFGIDERDFQSAIQILKHLGISKIKLLTNNPDKISALDTTDINVVSREKIIIPPCTENLSYLKTKQQDLGHMLELDEVIGA